MHECKICNYSTIDKSNLKHHNLSKRHIIKMEKYNEENKYDIDIIGKQNKEIEELKQQLLIKEQEKELLIKDQEKELILKEKEKELLLKDKDKEIEKLESIAKIYKEMAEKPKNLNQGIIINNNMQYVTKHFKNAPPLKKISNYTINGINLEDDNHIDQLTDKIIYSYNNKCLHKLIGDHIIENYKKDDLKLQSFHTTDVSRRKYLVKLDDKMDYLYDDTEDEIDNYNIEHSEKSLDSDDEYNELKDLHDKELENKTVSITKNKSKWRNDNEGVKLSYLLFEPIIKKIIKQLRKKCRIHNMEMKKNKKKIPTKNEAERFEVLASILKEIDTDKLKKNINNYIAPYFGLHKK